MPVAVAVRDMCKIVLVSVWAVLAEVVAGAQEVLVLVVLVVAVPQGQPIQAEAVVEAMTNQDQAAPAKLLLSGDFNNGSLCRTRYKQRCFARYCC
jgi:hypothetical protein